MAMVRGTLARTMRTCSTQAIGGEWQEARKVLEMPPASLEVPPRGVQLRQEVVQNPILRALVWAMGYHSKESSLLRASENLMQATKEQMDNERLFLGEWKNERRHLDRWTCVRC